MLLRDGSNHSKPIEYPKETYTMIKEIIKQGIKGTVYTDIPDPLPEMDMKRQSRFGK